MIGSEFADVQAQAQVGDEEAFARLFRDVQPVLLRYLRLIAADAAEDVAADTWLRVVTGLARFSGGEEAFRSWLVHHRPAPEPQRPAGARATVPRPRARQRSRARE